MPRIITKQMHKSGILVAIWTVLATVMLVSCSQSELTNETDTQPVTQANLGQGTLQIRANGENFIRQGFSSKDGWNIIFAHVYINLTDITAYQTDPPFNPEVDSQIQATEKVVLDKIYTVDLAKGGTDATPILVESLTDVPAGQYNALSWKMVKATEGVAQGNTLVMIGKAQKDGQAIDFSIALNQPLEFVCGEFVGDERKGILVSGGMTNLEVTFHFDHLFGDANKPTNDTTNVEAFGFEPFATLSKDTKINVDQKQLESRLSSQEYQKLQDILSSLGHVGEGHCETTQTIVEKSS